MKISLSLPLSLLPYGCTTFPISRKPTTGGQPYPTEIYITVMAGTSGIIMPPGDVNTVLPASLKNGLQFRSKRSGAEIGCGAIRLYRHKE